MNILFIENERDLAATGISPLELKGYTVYPAYGIEEAQALLDDPEKVIHFIITDYRVLDGFGIKFLLDIKESFPLCKCAVVSGCLTDNDIESMECHQIPYYHKPLLYGKVIDDLRRVYAAQAAEHLESDVSTEASEKALPTDEEKKAGFHLWPFK